MNKPQCCGLLGVRPSMRTVGATYDKAMAEGFCAGLEPDLIHRRVWKTMTDARLDVFAWLVSWYIPRRRHSP